MSKLLEILNWTALDEKGKKAALARAPLGAGDVHHVVASVVADVRARGDAAVRAYSGKFDGYDGPIAYVSATELDAAVQNLDPAMRRALTQAVANVRAFHKAQQPSPVRIETMPGVVCEKVWRPIERVGLYVPAGTAPLFSALIMAAVPAVMAGCPLIVLCAKPERDGKINPVILATARLCGVDKILPIGGAQAIAAMAYGTESVPKVDKIMGPGNAYVTEAKRLVAESAEGAAMDMPAGPSEVMVLATRGANPAFVAADLLAQAEHGTDSQAILVTPDADLAAAARAETLRQMENLPRKALIEKSLASSRVLVVPDVDTGIAVANAYGPEHLILQSGAGDDESASWVARINTAGSVFVGSWSTETGGDYATGTNHVLPTYGYARTYAGLNLLTFMRSMTVQRLSAKGLEAIAPTLLTMARGEGLEGHAAAVSVRLERLAKDQAA